MWPTERPPPSSTQRGDADQALYGSSDVVPAPDTPNWTGLGLVLGFLGLVGVSHRRGRPALWAQPGGPPVALIALRLPADRVVHSLGPCRGLCRLDDDGHDCSSRFRRPFCALNHPRVRTHLVRATGSASVISHWPGRRTGSRGRVIRTRDTVLVWDFLGRRRIAWLGFVAVHLRHHLIAPHGLCPARRPGRGVFQPSGGRPVWSWLT